MTALNVRIPAGGRVVWTEEKAEAFRAALADALPEAVRSVLSEQISMVEISPNVSDERGQECSIAAEKLAELVATKTDHATYQTVLDAATRAANDVAAFFMKEATPMSTPDVDTIIDDAAREIVEGRDDNGFHGISLLLHPELNLDDDKFDIDHDSIEERALRQRATRIDREIATFAAPIVRAAVAEAVHAHLDADRLAAIRRFFLERTETVTLAEIADLCRAPMDDVREYLSNGEPDVESVAWPDAAEFVIFAPKTIRIIDLERALGDEFGRFFPDDFRTVPVVIHLPRATFAKMEAEPYFSGLNNVSPATHIEAVVLNQFDALQVPEELKTAGVPR